MIYYPCDNCPRNDLCRGAGCDKWKYWFSAIWSELQCSRKCLVVVTMEEEKRAMNYREYVFSHIFTMFWR